MSHILEVERKGDFNRQLTARLSFHYLLLSSFHRCVIDSQPGLSSGLLAITYISCFLHSTVLWRYSSPELG